MSLFEHSPNDKPIIWRTFPIVVTREELWRNQNWVGRSSKVWNARRYFDVVRSIFLRTGMREGSWSALNETGPGGGTCALLAQGIEGNRALFSLRGYPHISLSLSFSIWRIFRSSSSISSIHSGEYYVWATSMDTCNSLVSSVRILLNSFVLRESIHVGIVRRLACLYPRRIILSRPNRLFLFDFVCCWKDEYTVFLFFILFLVIFSAIFDQRRKINFRLAKVYSNVFFINTRIL